MGHSFLTAPPGFARLSGSTDRTEPICWSWRPPDADDIEDARFHIFAPPDGYRYGSLDHHLNLLRLFCRYRCTVCGDGDQRGRKLHMDHDHATDMCRGVLCYRCNQDEGYRRGELFDNYRLRPPAAIVGVHVEWSQGLGPAPMPELGKFWFELGLHDQWSKNWRRRDRAQLDCP